MKKSIVMYPLQTMSHLAPMVELAKLFIPHNFNVSILLMHNPFMSSSVSDFIASVSVPGIEFHHLPPPALPIDPSLPPPLALFQAIRNNNQNLRQFIDTRRSSVGALVLDFFCTDALDVASEFDLPSFFLFTTAAFVLSAFIYLPTLAKSSPQSLRELGEELLEIPGCPPIPANHLPAELMDTHIFETVIHHFSRLPRAHGILVNSFECLESRAVRALREGLCTPGTTTPPVYCLGPMVTERKEERHVCVEWLDSQPRESVVFLCFGSEGAFEVGQMKEIARGLERSGKRFLWVINTPTTSGGPQKGPKNTGAEPELDKLLGEGFLDRTKDRGLVVTKWAPQMEVLGHAAVGVFVTHCGWNSILESIVSGVPMIAWPLYAEQRMNKCFLVEEAKVGVAIEGAEKGTVAAEELERKVRWVMETEGGKEMRRWAKEVMRRTIEARSEGGSSEKALLELVMALRS